MVLLAEQLNKKQDKRERRRRIETTFLRRRPKTTTIIISCSFQGRGRRGGRGLRTRFSEHQSELSVLVVESRSPYFLQKILLKIFQLRVLRQGKVAANITVKIVMINTSFCAIQTLAAAVEIWLDCVCVTDGCGYVAFLHRWHANPSAVTVSKPAWACRWC